MVQNNTYLIRLSGIVQGVGFRPFVYNLAKAFQLTGFISNGLDGVKILINANKEKAEKFYEAIIQNTPSKAQIIEKSMEVVEHQFFENFKIRESEYSGNAELILTPDYAICEDCKSELNDPNNRRFEYPFITCTNCGPRYSITEAMPFDRQNTTMASFEMCFECKAEYEDPTDRRFYSQTNSCPKCGIKLSIFDGNQNLVSTNQNECIDLIINYLKEGFILAIKGIGGYLLISDATNSQPVSRLRERKHRPTKPFAIMCTDLKMVEVMAHFDEEEKKALASHMAPIVLLHQKLNTPISDEVNPGLNKIGIMLAYSPLMLLICQKFNKPIVATSGNISGNPIIYDDSKALIDFAEIADYIITNDREIVIPQDDSVMQFTKKNKKRIILRRGRGFELGKFDFDIPSNTLAFGASIKSSFALKSNRNLYMSQYIGDLESYETQQNFENILQHYQKLFGISESTIFSDAHEGYFSSQLANEIGTESNTSVIKIQHHQAHLAAVLAENHFQNNDILGVVWDGTGYGTDGNIWGGEFFNLRENKRIHFEYFDAILGDKMPREPRISALSLTYNLPNFEPFIKEKFSENEWKFYQKIIQKNSLKTCSVGRLFDGVASLLILIDVQSYEGEAAILLEQLAQSYFDDNGYDFNESYIDSLIISSEIPIKMLINGILNDLSTNQSRSFISAKFHFSLIKIIEKVAIQSNFKNIAFSGGGFQNALLVDLLIHHLQPNFKLFFHENLPPNDENIAFGQIMYHHTILKNH